MSHTIFGYGSLLLIESVIARFNNQMPDVDELYKNKNILEDNPVTTTNLQDILTKYTNLTFTPAKINGFIRTYTFESKRGGTMLEAYYTGRESDILNGILITGLTDKQYEAIQTYEKAYDTYTINPTDFSFYTNNQPDIDITPCTLYLGGNSNKTNWTTRKPRNPTYHSRILAGIEQISHTHSQEIKNEFWKEFTEHTYEYPNKTLELTKTELNNF